MKRKEKMHRNTLYQMNKLFMLIKISKMPVPTNDASISAVAVPEY